MLEYCFRVLMPNHSSLFYLIPSLIILLLVILFQLLFEQLINFFNRW